MRPLVCMRCGAFYGQREIVVPGEQVVRLKTPQGELESIRLDHPTVDACLKMLAAEGERQKQEIKQASDRLKIVQEKQSELLRESRKPKAVVLPRGEVQ